MGAKRIVLSDMNLASVVKKVNADFEGCPVTEVIGSLAVSKKYEDQCVNLYGRTKTFIENKVNPIDLESMFEKDASGKALKSEVVVIDTLFGAEYLLGEVRWQIAKLKNTDAKATLITAALANEVVKKALMDHGILKFEYTIDYSRIHSILEPLRSKADIPDDLAILRNVVELVETERSVRVSTIKENFSKEGTV